jgi:hypothetical protein
LQAVADEQDALVAAVDLSAEDRAAVLDRVAALAAELVPLEREACAALSEI